MCVLFDGSLDYLVDRSIVSQVDDLGALRLEDATHDVDGGVVAIEQRGGGDDPDAARPDRSRRGESHCSGPSCIEGVDAVTDMVAIAGDLVAQRREFCKSLIEALQVPTQQLVEMFEHRSR